MKIKIVYFASLIPNLWEPIIIEQLEALKKLNLYSIASHIYMSVIANDNELSKLKLLLAQNFSKIQLKNIYSQNYYEYVGIKTIYQIAEDEDDILLLYFHSKGITSNQHDVRKYLFKHTIENYKEYINEFKTNKNLEVAGAIPHHNGFCFFNFFWVRSSYVRNYCTKPLISDNRYIWEVWISNEFSRKKNINIWSPIIGYQTVKTKDEIWNVEKINKINTPPIINNEEIDFHKEIQSMKKEIEKLKLNNKIYLEQITYFKQNYENKFNSNKSFQISEEIKQDNFKQNNSKQDNCNEEIKDNCNEEIKDNCNEEIKDNCNEGIKDNYKQDNCDEEIKQDNSKQDNSNEEIKDNCNEGIKDNYKQDNCNEEIKDNCNEEIKDNCNEDKMDVDINIINLINRYLYSKSCILNLSSIDISKLIKNNYKKILWTNNISNTKELKEFLYNNIYVYDDKLSIIYCNLLEVENIIEDLLHHVFINKIKLIIKLINPLNIKYNYLLSYFNQTVVEDYLLIEPKNILDLQLIKKNLTVVIIGYNQYTYIKKMVNQLKDLTNDIIIIDNNSTFKPLLDYYETEYKYTLLKMDKNHGHKVYERKFVNNICGNLFVITDPDLEFNEKLPKTVLNDFIRLSNQYRAGRIGMAIEINSSKIRSELTYAGMPLKTWEGRFWTNKIKDSKYELYNAPIDTTFCLLNYKHNKYGLSIRVAGNYVCKHLPWYYDFERDLIDNEYNSYLKDNISSNFFKLDKTNIKNEENWIINKIKKDSDYLIIGKNLLFDDPKKYFKNVIMVNYESKQISFSDIKHYNKNVVQLKETKNDITIKELFYELLKESYNVKFIHYNGDNNEIMEDLLYIGIILKLNIYIKLRNNIEKYKYLLDHYRIYEEGELINNINNINYDKELLLEINLNFCKETIKKNISVVIIGYNQYTYIKKMVEQVEKFTNDIIIIDNNSNYPKLLDYYETEYKYSLLKQEKNYGHKIMEIKQSLFNNLLGDIYILTDPDLEFNKSLPINFIDELVKISNYFQAEKVGFALLIDSPDIRQDVKSFGKSIVEWEKQYWCYKLYYPNHEIYNSAIDTTFCLVNRQNKGGHYRVAGDYVCKHLPWHNNFEKELYEGEFEHYLKNNISTNYWKSNN